MTVIEVGAAEAGTFSARVNSVALVHWACYASCCPAPAGRS